SLRHAAPAAPAIRRFGASVVGVVDGAQPSPRARFGRVELRGQRLALEARERGFTRPDGGGRLLAPWRVEVVPRANGCQPPLVAGEVGVGLLELGVRRAPP